jgi:hypothetical protein
VPCLLGTLAGLLVGGGIASGIFLLLMNEQQRKYEEALAAAGLDPLKFAKMDPGEIAGPGKNSRGKQGGKTYTADEQKILEIGKELVHDLEKNRITSVYRSISPAFQLKMQREAFEEMVNKVPTLKHLEQNEASREYKLKNLKNDQYEFYFTAEEKASSRLVNVFFLLQEISGEWKVSEVEITRDEK